MFFLGDQKVDMLKVHVSSFEMTTYKVHSSIFLLFLHVLKKTDFCKKVLSHFLKYLKFQNTLKLREFKLHILLLQVLAMN